MDRQTNRPTMGWSTKLALLFQKNWKMKRRSWLVLLFETAVPIFFAVFAARTRVKVDFYDVYHSTIQRANRIDNFFTRLDTQGIFKNYTIAYTPVTNTTGVIMQFLQEEIETKSKTGPAVPIGFTTEENATAFAKEYQNVSIIIVLHGHDTPVDNVTVPTRLNLTLRPVHQDFSEKTKYVYDYPPRTTPQCHQPWQHSIVDTMQFMMYKAVARFWLQERQRDPYSLTWDPRTQCLPWPPYKYDPFVEPQIKILPLFLIASFLVPVVSFTKSLVSEKEYKLKEVLKMMGVKPAVYWLSYLLMVQSYLVPIIFIYTVFLSVQWSSTSYLGESDRPTEHRLSIAGPVIGKTSPTIFFFFLICYGFAITTYCFMVSSFVKRANIGAVTAGIIFFALYVPYRNVRKNYQIIGRVGKLGACLSFNVAMGLGIYLITIRGGTTAPGIAWDNFHDPLGDDNLSMADCMLMLLVDSVLHCVIAWYVDQVMPGETGVARPPWFFVTRSYWRPNKVRSPQHLTQSDYDLDVRYFEPEPTNLKPGIQMQNLRKVFGDKLAVRGTSLDMFEGQITVLLGHNGAGKTVTMSMLTGFIPPTNGTAFVDGYDIRTSMDAVRSSMGVCPQFNILYQRLTVYEHLLFFSALKGFSGEELEEDCLHLIKEVGLENKKDAMAGSLSGGQKRKLSVAIALVGGSKVVILDEPTAGMDPAARRQTWHVLKRAREGRTILLTTHYMDEADMLGDRVAIMAAGVIECCGSSMFLKKIYGSGYHLIINTEPGCDVHSLFQAVRNVLPDAELEGVVRNDTTFTLPETETPLFRKLFDSLEASKQILKINSFGISTTSMEEVFLRVEHTRDKTGDMTVENSRRPSDENVGILPMVVGPSGTRIDKVFNKSIGSIDKKDTRSIRNNVVMQLANRALLGKTFSDGKSDIKSLAPSDIRSRAPSEVKSLAPSDTKSVARSVVSSAIKSVARDGANSEVKSVALSLDKDGGVSLTDEIPSLINSRSFADSTAEAARLRGRKYASSVLRALLTKRMIVCKRSWISFLGQTFLPFAIICFVFDSETPGTPPKSIPLVLDLARFKHPMVPYDTGQWGDPEGRMLSSLYAGLFRDLEYVELDRVDLQNKTMDEYVLARIKDLGHHKIIYNLPMGMALTSYYKDRPQQKHVKNGVNVSKPVSSPLRPVAYFNDYVRHSRRISMNYLLNALLQSDLNEGNETFYIQSILSPYDLPPHPKKIKRGKSKVSAQETILNAYPYGVAVGIGMPFSVIQSLQFLILEKRIGAKHMQVLSGAGPFAYWGINLVFDFCTYCLSASMVMVAFFIFPEEAFTTNWPMLGLIFICYGWVSLNCIYILQFIFNSPAAAAVCYISGSIITGSLATIAMLLLNAFGLQKDISFGDAREAQTFLSIAVPGFNLMNGVMNIHYNYYSKEICGNRNCTATDSRNRACCPIPCNDFCFNHHDNYLAWSNPGIGSCLACMLLQGAACLALVLLLDFRLVEKLLNLLTCEWVVGKHAHQKDFSGEDEDVAIERNRILAKPPEAFKTKNPEEDRVSLVKLYKCYGQLVAVDHICVGVAVGECFGLLGQNGAGKTSTFKTVSGDVHITTGEAHVMGYSVSRETKRVQHKLGYCPQFEGLILKMTGRETLTMYARLRGLPEAVIPQVVNRLIYLLDFDKHADSRAAVYSGGTKRKLNTAVSLMGDPPILLLDEPSWGMDPKARRHLWDVLADRREEGTTMLLTSHSMEECEALCTRMAIMVNGRFTCLGSVQHLKSKFGDGYTFIVQLSPLADGSPAPTDTVIKFIEDNVDGCELFDHHQNYLHFRAPDCSGRLGQIFQLLEGAKGAMHIADYSVQQTTLEQVFLSFTREQKTTNTDPSRAWVNRLGLGKCQEMVRKRRKEEQKKPSQNEGEGENE